MKCNWIEKMILKKASKIIDKHVLSDDPKELSPFVLDMLEISNSFDRFVEHMSMLTKNNSPKSVFIPFSEQKYTS